MTKYTLLVFCFFLNIQLIHSQNPVFDWINTAGKVNYCVGNGVANDNAGNVYTIGYFVDTVDFDPGNGVSNLISKGNNDVFIQKFNASGVLLWVKSIGSIGNDMAFSIAVDALGNPVIAGVFSGTTDFDPGPGTSNVSVNTNTAFVWKLTSAGNFTWVKTLTNFSQANGVTIDSGGNILVTGYFSLTSDFDPGASSLLKTSSGLTDVFVWKLTSAGSLIWAQTAGGLSNDAGQAITTDNNDNIYITGQFTSTADMNPGSLVFNLFSHGNLDIFIQKLDASGNFLWVKGLGTYSNEYGTSLATASDGSVYIGGECGLHMDMDPGYPTYYISGAGSNTNMFVLKLNASGNFIWAKESGGGGRDVTYCIKKDASENIYIASGYGGTTDLDPGLGIEMSFGNNGASIQKFDPNGSLIWARGFPGTVGFSYATGICLSGNSIYICGSFGTMDADPQASQIIKTSTGLGDAFILKITDNNCTLNLLSTSVSPICYGASATLEAESGATNYQWYNYGIALGSPQSQPTLTVNTPSGYYSVMATKSCGTVTSNQLYFTYINNPTPTFSSSLTVAGFCPPGYATLTANETGVTYQWIKNGVNISGATQSTYTATQPGNYTLAETANGCTRVSNSLTINLATGVGGTAYASDNTICLNDSTKIIVQQAIPGYSYQWKLNGTIIPGATSSEYYAKAPGSYTCTITASCGSGTTNAVTILQQQTSLPTISITANGPTSFCGTSASVQLTANASAGTSLLWLKNGSYTSTTTSTYNATTAGTYTCAASIGCGYTFSNSITTTVGYNPDNNPINGTKSICKPSTGNIYSVSNLPGVTYNWTVPSGATIVNGQGTNQITVDYNTSAVSGNICVVAIGCSTTVSRCLQMNIRTSAPSAPTTITGPANACPGDAWVYKVKKISNADYYIWTPPTGATIQGLADPYISTDTSMIVAFTSGFYGDTIRVSAMNCKGVRGERKLRINNSTPSTPGTITGLNVGLCNQSNVSYSIIAVANAISYTWRSTIAGITFNGNASPYTTSSTSVMVNFGTFTSGQIFVKANNGCGSGNERSLTVNARPAVPSSINGPSTVCDGQLGVAYSTTAVTNASAYNWTVPSGAIIASGQNSTNITVNFGATPLTGNVRVRAQNVCANSSYRNLSVTVNNCPRVGSEIQSDLIIYPNPFTETAIIEIPTDAILPNCTLQITDITGKLVRTVTEISEYSIILKKEMLSPGLYYLQLFTGDKTYSAKVMLQ